MLSLLEFADSLLDLNPSWNLIRKNYCAATGTFSLFDFFTLNVKSFDFIPMVILANFIFQSRKHFFHKIKVSVSNSEIIYPNLNYFKTFLDYNLSYLVGNWNIQS